MTEFEVISRYFKEAESSLNTEVPIGEDCAVFIPSPGMNVAVSVDATIEGRHVPKNCHGDGFAHRCLRRSLSDIAAQGAEAKYILLSLTLPSFNKQWLDDFASAFFNDLKLFKITLLGGDISKGHMAAHVTSFGEVPPGQSLLRNGTVLKDDPRLTVRFSDAKINPSPLSYNDQPLRIIVDSSGRLPKNPALVAEPGPIYWVTTKNHHNHPLIDNGRIKHLPVPANKDGRVDLSILVRELGLLEINEILVEAGGILSGAFIKAGLVDRARIYFASKILGCDAQAIYKIMPKDLPSAIEIKIKKVDKVGDSFFVEWILENS